MADGQQVSAVIPVGALAHQGVHQFADALAAGQRQAQQVGVAGLAGIKASGQAGLRGGKLFHKIPVQPQHNALITDAPLREAGLVQLIGVDQQNIAGLQMIVAALYNIVHTAVQKQIDLVKIMVVQHHIF